MINTDKQPTLRDLAAQARGAVSALLHRSETLEKEVKVAVNTASARTARRQNKRLKAMLNYNLDLRTRLEDACKQIDGMESETAKLRGALEQIAGTTMSHVLNYEHGFTRCRQIASDALSGNPP